MNVRNSLLAAALSAAFAVPSFAADNVYVNADTVRQAQKALHDRGFRTGGIDGQMGPQTQAALVNFQRAEKLQPTGKLDGATMKALGLRNGDASASAGASGRYGAATIRKAQETLNARGYKAGPATGEMNAATGSALRAFQKSEGLKVTGRLNPRTLKHLGMGEQSASAGKTAR